MLTQWTDDDLPNTTPGEPTAPLCPHCSHPLTPGECCPPDIVAGYWCDYCGAFWEHREIESEEVEP